MKQLYFVVLFFFFQVFTYGQQSKTDSLLNILKSAKEDTTKVNTCNTLFLNFEFSDDTKAQDYLNQALKLSQKLEYKKGLATTYLYLGYFAEDKGNFTEALKNYISSSKINESIDNKKGLADAYNSIGNIYGNQGNYPEALKNYFASLRIKEKMLTSNNPLGSKKGIAATYGNIGTVYYSQNNYSEALKNDSTCLKMMEALGNKLGEADAYNNIGMNYAALGNDAEALKNYFASLKLREDIGYKSGIADSYVTIANIYSKQSTTEQNSAIRASKLDQALKDLLIALKIKEAIGGKAGIDVCYLNIGNILTKKKNYPEAEKYLTKAKELSKEIGAKPYLRNAYNLLTVMDSAKGDFKGAYENHKLCTLYSDSLDNEETRKKTIQNQMTFDFEKKEAVASAEHKKELENQQALADEKSRKQHIVLLLVSCFLLLVLFFAGFIFRSLRITRRQKDVIQQQKSIVEEQKKAVEEQKVLVEEKQKEIIDSITYARRIQRSLLPTENYIEKQLKRLIKK